MLRCSHPGCAWQAIAPSRKAALTQYADHLVESHAKTVDVEIPDGMVQIKLPNDDEWITATVEEAHELHETVRDP